MNEKHVRSPRRRRGWINQLKEDCHKRLHEFHKEYGVPHGIPKPKLDFFDDKTGGGYCGSNMGTYMATDNSSGVIRINIRAKPYIDTLEHEYKHHLQEFYGLLVDSFNAPSIGDLITVGKFYQELKQKKK